ncbi:helix-turn-helix domain-containing protein [Paenibacillus profundus]|uniref:Helix-turn-helix domain-containing protein n=1 Tax=Paenibacillus profundus TaxID=1173085 RepID=A0ABS8YK95_9BACL|nr:helix-turn-helix domain-containing protein [Paenibacillus profundus]
MLKRSLADIGQRVGYGHIKRFNRVFMEFKGIPRSNTA